MTVYVSNHSDRRLMNVSGKPNFGSHAVYNTDVVIVYDVIVGDALPLVCNDD